MDDRPGDDCLIGRAPHLVTASVDTGALIIDAARARFIDLNPMAAHFWRFLERPRTLSSLVAAAQEMFDVDEETCRVEAEQWLGEMSRLGLVVAE